MAIILYVMYRLFWFYNKRLKPHIHSRVLLSWLLGVHMYVAESEVLKRYFRIYFTFLLFFVAQISIKVPHVHQVKSAESPTHGT